jgi:hypothetical protein
MRTYPAKLSTFTLSKRAISQGLLAPLHVQNALLDGVVHDEAIVSAFYLYSRTYRLIVTGRV